jgi:hypothetical protein
MFRTGSTLVSAIIQIVVIALIAAVVVWILGAVSAPAIIATVVWILAAVAILFVLIGLLRGAETGGGVGRRI